MNVSIVVLFFGVISYSLYSNLFNNFLRWISRHRGNKNRSKMHRGV